jgi:hypothetical protein
MSLLVALGRLLGLTWLTLGIFLEKPVFFALSVVCLVLVIAPREVGRRLLALRLEFAVMLALIGVQFAAGGLLNALTLLLLLLGLINGLLLPDPRAIGPRFWPAWLLLAVAITAAYESELLAAWGLVPSESAFGSNIDEYEIDPRSLSYAVVIVLLYLSPHFAGPAGVGLHVLTMTLAAALGTNKFGIVFSLLKNLPRRLVAPAIAAGFLGLAVVGFSVVDITAARAALWSDFFANFPRCDAALGVCTDLILVNNEEGVRSFHSLALDFTWYGGWPGLVAASAFIWRAATVRSLFGRSAGTLFALALLFGFPPFFNDRHVLLCYAFLVLFQEGRAARVADRPLRAHGAAPGGPGRPGLVPGA